MTARQNLRRQREMGYLVRAEPGLPQGGGDDPPAHVGKN